MTYAKKITEQPKKKCNCNKCNCVDKKRVENGMDKPQG